MRRWSRHRRRCSTMQRGARWHIRRWSPREDKDEGKSESEEEEDEDEPMHLFKLSAKVKGKHPVK